MTHLLFKLKKDGKTVGYERHALLTPDTYIVILHSKHGRWSELGCYNIAIHKDKFIIHDEKFPFIFRDKNNKKVFAGDKISFVPVEGFGTKERQIAEVYFGTRRLAFCVKSKTWEVPIKKNCKDIELIETQNETDKSVSS